MGLQAAIAKKVKILKIYEDSALVIYQLREDWLTRDSKMILYHKLAMEMVDHFEVINFEYLSREENQMANALAIVAAMFQVSSNNEVQLIRMSIKEESTHCLHIEEEVDEKLWYHNILQYVKSPQYPDHASENDKRILKRLAMGFLLDGEVLYKKGKGQILLRCVDSLEVNRIVEEIHEGVCGTHANGHRMAGQDEGRLLLVDHRKRLHSICSKMP